MSWSSAEVEYRAIAQCICEVIWIEILLEDFNIPTTTVPTKLYTESKQVINIINNLVQHDRMIHVGIVKSFIKQVENGGISLTYIPTKSQ